MWTDYQAQWAKDFDPAVVAQMQKAVEERRRSEHVPEVQQLYDDKKALGNAGFWDFYDKGWEKYTTAMPDSKAAGFPTFNAWYDDMVKKTTDQLIASGTNPKSAKDEADQLVQKTATYKDFTTIKDKMKDAWVIEHKDDGLAELAWKWEYITANKYRKFLFGN
jgi:hypothetical protein